MYCLSRTNQLFLQYGFYCALQQILNLSGMYVLEEGIIKNFTALLGDAAPECIIKHICA